VLGLGLAGAAVVVPVQLGLAGGIPFWMLYRSSLWASVQLAYGGQQLAVSGEPIDANTVGYVGYTLARRGYAPQMPCEAPGM
jgi:hypothetical protein